MNKLKNLTLKEKAQLKAKGRAVNEREEGEQATLEWEPVSKEKEKEFDWLILKHKLNDMNIRRARRREEGETLE